MLMATMMGLSPPHLYTSLTCFTPACCPHHTTAQAAAGSAASSRWAGKLQQLQQQQQAAPANSAEALTAAEASEDEADFLAAADDLSSTDSGSGGGGGSGKAPRQLRELQMPAQCSVRQLALLLGVQLTQLEDVLREQLGEEAKSGERQQFGQHTYQKQHACLCLCICLFMHC